MCTTYDRVQNDLPRTNDAVEGWHKSFNTNIGGHHVNFWKKEEDLSRVKFVHLQQGRAPANRHIVYAAVNARICNVVASYANRQPHGLYTRNCDEHHCMRMENFYSHIHILSVCLTGGYCPGG